MVLCNGLTKQGTLCRRSVGKDMGACQDHAGISWLKGQIVLRYRLNLSEEESMFAMEQEWAERKELDQMDEHSVLSGVVRKIAVAQLIPQSATVDDRFFTPPSGQLNSPVLRKHLITPPFLHD